MKRLISVLLTFLIVLNLGTLSAAAFGEQEVYVEQTHYEASDATQKSLSDAQRQSLWDTLHNGILASQSKIDISSFKLTRNDENVSLLGDLIYDSMPDCFHVTGYSYSYNSSNKITSVKPKYSVTADEYKTMFGEVEAAADKILDGIKGNDKLGEVEKALLIHDRLALSCEYDYNYTANRYNIYGALALGTSVCEGYAEAYDYLLDQVGIESYLCQSSALYHAWNIVYINDIPYHVDVTWDDIAWETGERGAIGAVKHDNFLRSSDGIHATKHTASDYDTTPTDTTYDNYFWQNSQTAFQLVEDEIYYIDGSDNYLKRYSDHAPLTQVADRWYASSGYWVGNFSRLSTDGKNLYFSLTDSICRFDPVTMKTEEIFSIDLTRPNWIYGFVYEDGNLVCDINNAPPYGDGNALYQIKEPYTATNDNRDPDLNFLALPGLSFQDYIGMQVLVPNTTAAKYDYIYVLAVKETPDGAASSFLFGSDYFGVYQVFDQQVLSWSMTEQITLSLMGVRNGVAYEGAKVTASVAQLAMDKLKTYSEKNDLVACRALVDMLNYGAAVQAAYNYNAGSPANANLGSYSAYGTTTTPVFNAENAVSGTGKVAAGMDSVSMQAKVEVQFLFTTDISGYTPKAYLGNSEATIVMDYTYSAYGWTIVKIPIAAGNMRSGYSFALYDGNGNAVTQIYRVSVEAYAAGQLGGTYNDVVIAMMRYGDSVAAIA